MLTFPCIPPRVAPMERVQMKRQRILLIALIIQLIIQGDFSCLNECKYLNERIAVQILARRACSRARGRAESRCTILDVQEGISLDRGGVVAG